MDWISNPEIWMALISLTVLETILGIDNVIFISIVSEKLPVSQQSKARNVGLGLAMFIRIGLLFSISWLISLTSPLFEVMSVVISGRDIILIVGGMFLMAKATYEIHDKLEAPVKGDPYEKAPSSFTGVIVQILMLDMVFSLDSVITAIGMTSYFWVMVAAIVISIGIMILSAGPISRFVRDHPTVKMLALSFLILIGVMLIAEGFDQHIPKGYIYFAMGFSVFVEMLNLKLRGRGDPVQFKHPKTEEQPT